MSKPAPMSQKKRKLEDGMRGKTQKARKKFKKQKAYHSSSEEENDSDTGFAPVGLDDSEEEAPTQKSAVRVKEHKGTVAGARPEPVESQDDSQDDLAHGSQSSEAGSDEDGSGSEEVEHNTVKRKTSKRNDPEAFSTSMSKILSTKLSQSVRKDPVLSRSKEATEVSKDLANERLEQKARAKMRTEKKEELERGRVKDVRGVSTGDTGKVAEEEKRLRKIAQRGVVKLFNAVRAAQVRGEQAAKEERRKGTIGMANREQKANEMSKQGFLELISGKPKTATAEIEEEQEN